MSPNNLTTHACGVWLTFYWTWPPAGQVNIEGHSLNRSLICAVKNIGFTQPTLFITPITCCQSGPSSEGALNYKIKVWLSLPPPPASSVDFEDFTAQSSLGNTINFPQGIRGHPLCTHSPHSTPLGHAWLIGRGECLHFCQSGSGWKRDFQGQNIKHQLDGVQIGK